MVRSRSRSPARRDRHRSRSRERDYDRRDDRRPERRGRYRSRSPSPAVRRRRSRSPIRRRSRSRSWSPPRRRSRSGSRGRGETSKEAPKRAVSKFLMERTPITEKDLEGKTEEEKEMMKLMGFGNFDTTKGKHVPGNVAYGVHVIHKRKYRQYMNRKGGFNRPLDFVA